MKFIQQQHKHKSYLSSLSLKICELFEVFSLDHIQQGLGMRSGKTWIMNLTSLNQENRVGLLNN